MTWRPGLFSILYIILVLFLVVKDSKSEVNQYGIDCDATPWYSSCQLDENSGEFINPQKDDDVTSYNISDDGYAQVDIPFDFTISDKTFITSFMHSNGVISFLAVNNNPYQSNFCCSGEDIEGILSGDYTGQNYYSSQGSTSYNNIPFISYSISALWTDLININRDIDGDGVNDTGFFTRKIDTNNDGDFDTLRYYWRNISEYYNNQYNNTFGVQIDDQNAVEIHYFDIDVRDHSLTIAMTGDLDNGKVQQFEYYESSQTSNYDMSWIGQIEGIVSQTNPDVKIVNFNLTDACAANPLISPNCDGYADAYAELMYDSYCAADPQYDTGCPGYTTETYTDTTDYADASFDIYDNFDTSSYDTTDTLNTYTMDTFSTDTTTEEVVDNTPVEETTIDSFDTMSFDNFDSYDMTMDTSVPESTFEESLEAEIEMELQQMEEEFEAEFETTLDEPIEEEMVEEPMEEVVEEETIEEEPLEEEPTEEEITEEEPNEEDMETDNMDSESEDSDAEVELADAEDESESDSKDSEDNKELAKKKKMKEILQRKATQLTEALAIAESIEAQIMAQAQLVSFINYVPGFNDYKGLIIPDGYYPDVPFYVPTQLKDGSSRNNLAQQLLHQQLVDLQFQ